MLACSSVNRFLFVAALLVVSCGGDVVVDDPPGSTGGGGAGSSGSSSSSSSSVTSSSATGGCDALLHDFALKYVAAQACDPAVSSPQCDGSAIISDTCGCPTLANEKNPAAVQAANDAWAAADAAGCLPLCGTPCTTVGGGFCQPTQNGGGICTPAIPPG